MSATSSMTPVKATAQIAVTPAGEMTTVSISGPLHPKPAKMENASQWDRAKDIGEVAAERLQIAISRVPRQPKLTPRLRDELIGRFHSLGVEICTTLVGSYRSERLEIGPGTLEESAALSLELVCPNSLILPVELLPVLQPVGSGADRLPPETAALLGFGAETSRKILRGAPLAETDGLDVTALSLYWDATLQGARREKTSLDGRFGAGLLGPSPEHRRVTRDELADQIIRKRDRPDAPQGPSAIEHFSCHHVRGKTKSAPDIVRLKPPGWFASRIPITASDLKKRSYGMEAKGGLVFLNACGTGPVSPRAVSSFASELYECGRTAIVATWCDVPDSVAAFMSTYFYDALFSGASVGEALRRARLQLLRKKNNPLGLLYTVYGDADYRLVE